MAPHTAQDARVRRSTDLRWTLARVVALVLALACVAVMWQLSSNDANAQELPGLKLVFSDEFGGGPGAPADGDKWQFATGHGYAGGAANWGTGEVEEMTDRTANASLDGQDHLAITPVRDEAGNWTSARLETRRTDFAAPPGGKLRIEAALQMPNVSGPEADGYWPAFWALGDEARANGAGTWPGMGEWDIMENVHGRESVFQTLHCGVAPGGPCNEPGGISGGEHPCTGCRTSFHTYALELDRGVVPEKMTWFVDGAPSFSVAADKMDAATWTKTTGHGMYLILNVAMGGAFPAALGPAAPTQATKSGVPMLVDYVRVYTT